MKSAVCSDCGGFALGYLAQTMLKPKGKIIMNILYMKYALEIAKTGSINKASETLYIAQPNLSRSMKELEVSLGVTLFERTSKGMTPTPEGEKFLQYAEKILRQVDEVESLFKSTGVVKQKFSVSVPRASYIAYAFSRFSNSISADGQVEIFYKETNSLEAINNIVNADYRLGIVRYAAQHDKYFKDALEHKGLQYELITEFSYVLVMSREHALANKEEITYDDLLPYIEIAHADPYVPSLPLVEVRKNEPPEGINRRIYVFERASQFELLAENPSTFMWVSPIPNELLNRYGLIQKICVQNKRVYKDVLIYKENYSLSELDKIFITELCEAKRKYL
ncbi:MAG: LysR family transcriptional regulator [Eubacteriales bacterium]|nr:LysR family transcriptional regulator [Eubacteriales bacterium]